MEKDSFITIVALLGIGSCAAMTYNNCTGIAIFYFCCLLASLVNVNSYSGNSKILIWYNVSLVLLSLGLFIFFLII